MALACTICTHPEREAIDEALVAGMANRAIGRRWDLHKDAVARHKANHLSAAVQAHVTEQVANGATTALGRLEHLFSRVERVLIAAEREGKANLVLQASSEMRQTAALLAKITGELDERNTVQVLNVSADPAWLATRQAMLEALAPYPDAARAVAARLLALEAPVVAGERTDRAGA
ncbi:hypothetical protein [Ornithinimicrobium panacihumi]|uniref:hypothetical protein n=1 Tax=Ornithinimicrobium panacihumi TaxID=2008449 RepID=UPI003F88A973